MISNKPFSFLFSQSQTRVPIQPLWAGQNRMAPLSLPAQNARYATRIPSMLYFTCADTCACATNVHCNSGAAKGADSVHCAEPSSGTSYVHTNRELIY